MDASGTSWSWSIPHVTTHFPAEEGHTNIEENNRAAAYAWLKDHI